MTEGYVKVTGGQVWYRIVSSESTAGATPLLLLHGGPGIPSHYLEPLAALADERPVVFYDQLGCGRSAGPAQAPDGSLWTVERFAKEVHQVKVGLGFDHMHVLGHSWGSILAVEYVRRHPESVRGLVLASPALSIPRWLNDANRLRSQLPPQIQKVLQDHERSATTDTKEYEEATAEFYKRFLCRIDPFPGALQDAFASAGWDVYHSMWGPSEFCSTGILRDYDCTDWLGALDVAVLFTCGRYDEATPETTAWYRNLIPAARMVIFEESSHMTMLEEPGRYTRAVRDFLRRVEHP